MIHAVAEGLALSWDQGASTAERLARESQRMDLSTNLALVRTTIARVCVCPLLGVAVFHTRHCDLFMSFTVASCKFVA